MALKIEVMSKAKAEEYAMNKHRDRAVVISIASYTGAPAFIIPNNANNIIDVLKLRFNDTDCSDGFSGGMIVEQGYKIKAFFNKYVMSADKLIVHCEAGQSRSAGVAAAIMKYYYNDDTPIFNNSRYTPNMRCYRITLNALMNI